MVNEYRNSINIGKIEVSRNDLKSRDGTYKFNIREFKEIKDYIGEGWRLPTKKEFKYIHSIWMDLDGLGLARNSDYWIYGEPMPHPINDGPLWELYPCVMMNGDHMEFVNMANAENLRIRLVKDI
jgi:hypothetical protein